MAEGEKHFYHIHLRGGYDDDVELSQTRPRKPGVIIPITMVESIVGGSTDDEDKRLAILKGLLELPASEFDNGSGVKVTYAGLIQIGIEKIYNEYTKQNGDDSSWGFFGVDESFRLGELPAGETVKSPYPRRVCVYEDSQGYLPLSISTVEPVDNTPTIKASEISCYEIIKAVILLNDPLVKLTSNSFDKVIIKAKQNEYIASR